MELFHTDTDYSTRILGVWGVPVAPDRPCWGQPALKLFGREIIFDVFQPM